MRLISAQYVFTNDGPPLKRAIISVDDDGTIKDVTDTGGNLTEKGSVEFYNGIITPGFVNCHCHLELSHMRNAIPRKSGLSAFLNTFRTARIADIETIISSARSADEEMYSNGTEICADICNTSHTFSVKQGSRIKYKNLLEVFGIDALKAEKRLYEIKELAASAEASGLDYSIVPHAAYSISLTLFRMLREITASNRISSMHFMETEAEKMLLERHEGPLMDSYRESELVSGEEVPELAEDHSTIVLDYITRSGKLILVHNTFAGQEMILKLRERQDLFWCLCPKANLYIENQIPPLDRFINNNCRIVLGTDSYASNDRLDILDEMKVLQDHFPGVSLEKLVQYATKNGAEALDEDQRYGSVSKGKKPGLLLLENLDIQNLKLLPETKVRRLL